MTSIVHPTDGALQELLDAEGPLAERERLEAHLSICPDCAARCATLARELATMRRLLDLPAPPRASLTVDRTIRRGRVRFPRHPWLIAAAATMLIAVAAGATVARSKLQVAARAAWALVRPARRPVEPQTALSAREAGVAVAPGSLTEIAFDAPQPEGLIVVALVDTTQLTIRATGPVTYQVGAAKVLVHNAASTATYDVAVPRKAARVRIFVAGRVVFDKQGGVVATQGQVLLGKGGADGTQRYVIPVR